MQAVPYPLRPFLLTHFSQMPHFHTPLKTSENLHQHQQQYFCKNISCFGLELFGWYQTIFHLVVKIARSHKSLISFELR